jgi:hypothetical protein
MITLKQLTVSPPASGSADWNSAGVVVLKGFIPNRMLNSYERCWLRNNRDRPGGWPYATPYMNHPELLRLITWKPLFDQVSELIGEPAGVHLVLSGWRSSTRNWHQDSYLNPREVGDFYAAVWIALQDIHEDSGPFQYVPGSHRWPQVTRARILAALPNNQRDKDWPWHSERILTPLFEREIGKRGIEPVKYLPKRGDVLIWHSRLLHRGTRPIDTQLERRALIAHYSGINHRPDMPRARKRRNHGYYFPIVDAEAC